MLIKILGGLTSVIFILTFYRILYTIVGFFCKSKTFAPAAKKHTYGIVIAARNEEAVIGRLIESIHRQDYDASLLKIFVVADNCTDNTAQICREMGAVVYERHDPARARKGYALEFLFDKLALDYGIDSFDGYIFFDADNLLRPNFITELNNAFDTGADLCIGYRNTKNFDENPISAAYGIHFMRSCMSLHRPRTKFGLSTHIAGTGWAVKSELLSGGWHCTYLTEDTQFTMKCVTEGRRIEYCEAAEFYDEQPHNLSVAFRQRTRWIKGRLCCFAAYVGKLLRGVFAPSSSMLTRLGCYDMFFYLFPKGLFTAFFSTVPAAVETVLQLARNHFAPSAVLPVLWTLLASLGLFWVGNIFSGALTVIRERKHIRCSLPKLLFDLLLWPWFDLIEVPLAVTALFRRVEWKPIVHDRAISISEMEATLVLEKHTPDTDTEASESEKELQPTK